MNKIEINIPEGFEIDNENLISLKVLLNLNL